MSLSHIKCATTHTIQLVSIKTYFHITGERINRFAYADDTVLLAPSAKALHQLINIRVDYATNHDMIYKANEQMSMVARPENCSIIHLDLIPVGSSIKSGTSLTYTGPPCIG